MLNIPYIQLKTTKLRKNLYTINKSGLQKNMRKIDDIIFCRRAQSARFQTTNLKHDWE